MARNFRKINVGRLTEAFKIRITWVFLVTRRPALINWKEIILKKFAGFIRQKLIKVLMDFIKVT